MPSKTSHSLSSKNASYQESSLMQFAIGDKMHSSNPARSQRMTPEVLIKREKALHKEQESNA